ncbi:MAG: hypothetical protein U9N86_13895, partial [Bacteroidota bacterium]|nr:hypothetical protein [Bacteroidota bacterium]
LETLCDLLGNKLRIEIVENEFFIIYCITSLWTIYYLLLNNELIGDTDVRQNYLPLNLNRPPNEFIN